jgi:hypothetical protein
MRNEVREYLKSFSDPEERARAIHEGGFSGHPDIADIESDAAHLGGGPFQKLLAALQPRPKPIPKRALQRMERRVNAGLLQWRRRQQKIKIKANAPTKAVDARPESAEPAAPDEQTEARSIAAKSSTQQALIGGHKNAPAPAPGSSGENFGRYVYENQAKIWPHLKGEIIPRPEWYKPKPAAPVPVGSGPFYAVIRSSGRLI